MRGCNRHHGGPKTLMNRNWKRLLRILPALLLSGCAAAPSMDVFGSYFPAWMICMVPAMLLAFAVHAVLVRVRLASEVGPVAVFYPCLVVLFSSLIWLIYFR